VVNNNLTNNDDVAILPQGWIWTNLKETSLKLQSGGTPSTKINEYYENGSIPFVKIEDMVNSQKYLTTTITKITKVGLENSAAWIVPKNSLLYSMYASYGVPIITRIDVATNQAIIAYITDDSQINSDYIFYYLISVKPRLKKFIRGTTQENLNAHIVSNIPIALAPLPEQHRIVNKIEEFFTQLDAGVASLKKAQAQLKRYRQAVLKAAFEGRLTQEWREEHAGEIEPANDLLVRVQRERQKIVKSKSKDNSNDDVTVLSEIPDGWVWTSWQNIGVSQNGRSFPSSDYQSEGVKLLRPGNLHQSGQIIWTDENTKCMPMQYETEFPSFIIGSNELIMNLTAQSLKDEFLGRICLTGNNEHCLLNQRLARLTPIIVEKSYIFWLLKSPIFRRFVDTLNTGSLIQHMFTHQLDEFHFPLPPLEEQKEIVSEIESKLSVIIHIERTIQSSLAQSESLRQSILKRAFEGKLVPQDPNDEPASVLLERIKAEKALHQTKAKSPRTPKRKIKNAN
jgi:type I restriction enzyme S subunit